MKLLVTQITFVVVLGIASSAVAQQPTQPADPDDCSVPVYTGKDLDRKPTILAKPDPDYSAEDRRKHAHEVTTLVAVLCGTGEVHKVRVTKGLGEDIDKKTIAAARKIRFIPGEKNGVKVSRPVILKYFVSQ